MSVNVINKAKLDAIGTSIECIYQQQYDKVEDNLNAVVYGEHHTKHAITEIASLDGFGLMREFKSERVPGVIGSLITIVKPKKYERTIDIKREDIEDDTYGYATDMAKTVAVASRRTPIKMVADVLMAGFTTNMSDGKTFFHADRGNLQTGALNATNLKAAREKLSKMTDGEGQPLCFVADTLVVGPNNQSAAEEILNSQMVSGSTNVLYKSLKLVVSPYITDNSWYVLSTKEGSHPLVFVYRVKPDKIIAKNDENSDRAFDKDVFSWGTRGRFAAAYHNPKLIVGSTGA